MRDYRFLLVRYRERRGLPAGVGIQAMRKADHQGAVTAQGHFKKQEAETGVEVAERSAFGLSSVQPLPLPRIQFKANT
jgi:hypothetical protein